MRMDILLVAATPLEMQAALAGLMPVKKAVSLAESLAGPHMPVQRRAAPLAVRGHRLFPLICGVGPVSAALHLGFALGSLRGRTSGVLNLGVAGTYDEQAAPVGSVIAASAEIFPEFGLATETTTDPLGLGFAQSLTPDGPVFDRIPPLQPDGREVAWLSLEKGLGNMGLQCHTFMMRGSSVTVAGASGNPERAALLARRTGGLTENMEGFALALGAARHGLAFAEIRAVSNVAGYRPPHRWDMPGALAALTNAVATLFAPQPERSSRHGKTQKNGVLRGGSPRIRRITAQ
jgi:futalosine hydrolase